MTLDVTLQKNYDILIKYQLLIAYILHDSAQILIKQDFKAHQLQMAKILYLEMWADLETVLDYPMSHQ